MQRLINTVTSLACVAVLAAGLWQEWSLLTTVKRMLIAYLGFFVLVAMGGLLVKMAGMLEKPANGSEKKQDQEQSVGEKDGGAKAGSVKASSAKARPEKVAS